MKNRLCSNLKGLVVSMGESNTLTTVAASVIEYARRKKQLKQINETNEINRRITNIGTVTPDGLIPSYESHGNIIVSGGTTQVRHSLILQNIEQAVNANIPVVILHENNNYIEYDVKNRFHNLSYVRIINDNETYYDPILRLNDSEISKLLCEASMDECEMPSDGSEYIKLISALCRKQGVTPYVRLLGGCPYDRLDEVITSMENRGMLTNSEALYFSNNLSKVDDAGSSVEKFMSALCSESRILAWNNNLGKSTSIDECVRAKGIISINVDSFTSKALIGLITAEIDNCRKMGKDLRLIIDGGSIKNSALLINILKEYSQNLSWLLSCPDFKKFLGGNDDISTWVALSHKVIILKNSLKSAEDFSKELGEYDRIDVAQAMAGGVNYGRFGLNMGGNSGLTTTIKRDDVIKPEEITKFTDREFLLLNNNTASLLHGFIQ